MLSYGAVSNVNMGVSMIMAWVTFGKSTGLSPLDAGQWPKFLAVGIDSAIDFCRCPADTDPSGRRLDDFEAGKPEPYSNTLTFVTSMSFPYFASDRPVLLQVYGGFWLAANFLRPFRMGIAVALTPSFDRLVGWLQKKFQITKAAAFAVTVLIPPQTLVLVLYLELQSLLTQPLILPNRLFIRCLWSTSSATSHFCVGD